MRRCKTNAIFLLDSAHSGKGAQIFPSSPIVSGYMMQFKSRKSRRKREVAYYTRTPLSLRVHLLILQHLHHEFPDRLPPRQQSMSLNESLSGERGDVGDEKLEMAVGNEFEELLGVGVELLGGEDEVVESGEGRRGEMGRRLERKELRDQGRRRRTYVGRVIFGGRGGEKRKTRSASRFRTKKLLLGAVVLTFQFPLTLVIEIEKISRQLEVNAFRESEEGETNSFNGLKSGGGPEAFPTVQTETKWSISASKDRKKEDEGRQSRQNSQVTKVPFLAKIPQLASNVALPTPSKIAITPCPFAALSTCFLKRKR